MPHLAYVFHPLRARIHPTEFSDEPTWPLYLPPAATRLPGQGEPDLGGSFVVVGPVDESPMVVDAASSLSRAIDQPIVVLAARPPGAFPDRSRVEALRTVLNVYGWRGKVPVVITHADVRPGPLLAVLDEYGASVVHQVPRSVTPTGTGGLTLNLGNAWVVRHPGATQDPGNHWATSLVAEALTERLLQDAAGRERRPAHQPPSVPVASFLSVPLTNPDEVEKAYTHWRDDLTLQVEQIARRDPTFSGHKALLSLGEMGHFGSAIAYLKATGDDRVDSIVRPLLAAADTSALKDGETAEAEQNVRAVLPHLAELAGGQINDPASHAILKAVDDLVNNRKKIDQVKEDVWKQKQFLPAGSTVRLAWAGHLRKLQDHLPARVRELDEVAIAIMTCPE